MKKVMAIVIALAGAGCLRTTTYKCTSNDMCTGTGGACELTGFCSFTDSGCAEGRRYGDLAGKFSNTCVGDLPVDLDGGVDGAPSDGTTTDVPVDNCPTSYLPISGQTHRYRVIATSAVFDTQVAACDADVGTTYLAVPDTKAELDAIITASGQNLTWVGINDMAIEDTYVTSKGDAFPKTSPLWDFNNSGEPDNNPSSGQPGSNGADCVTADSSNNNNLADDRCDTKTYPAVCECEP